MVKAAVLVLAALLLQDVDNPEYRDWARFKAGSFARLKTEREGKIVQETTTRLVSVSPGKVVLEDTIKPVTGKEFKQSREVPAKIAALPKPDEEGTEEVQAAGRKFKCRWAKYPDGRKVWTSDEVPGGVVKLESGTVTLLAEFKAE